MHRPRTAAASSTVISTATGPGAPDTRFGRAFAWESRPIEVLTCIAIMRFTFQVKPNRAIYQDLLLVSTCNGVAVRGTSTESGRGFRWTIVRFLRLRSTRVTRKAAGCCTRAGILPHALATFGPMLLQDDKSTNL